MTNFTDNILKILANYTTPEDRDLTECQCYLNGVCQKS